MPEINPVSAGRPSPWVTVPTVPMRLPEKFRGELTALARLLDDGLVSREDITTMILSVAKEGADRPAPPT